MFLGVGLAWQAAFLLIGRDPLRYRAFMVPALVEKGSAVLAVLLLYLKGRLEGPLFLLWSVDAVWFVLFLAAWLRTGRAQSTSR